MASSSVLPQPKSFAPSREDVLASLAFFFGDPSSPERLRDYSEHHALTFHFPDAYSGSNTKIRETLNNLILKNPQEWHTTVALPFVRIEGVTVEWDEIKFDVRLLQRVPYEGVSRMQTSLRRHHRDRVVRRGLGMMIESDFYATSAGRQHFSDQLTSIRYCVQETCNFDVIHAYLTCQNYDFRYDLSKGLRPKRSIRTAMQHEINMYAIVQREQWGLDKAIEEAKFRMARYQVSPNMFITAPQLLLYMALAPTEKFVYDIAGPQGPNTLDAGVAGYEARSFRGLGIFTSMPYEVSEDQESVQMLQRRTQVGEFYRMRKQHTTEVNNINELDIIIYDEELDQHVRITVQEAVKAAKGRTLADLSQGQNGLDEELKNGTKEIILVRPFIEHSMLSGIVAVSGRDTGATLYGPADMQISANTSVKTIEGHFTCHTKAVITKPQNVLVLRDIMCAGYVAGCNCRFFGQGDANSILDNNKTGNVHFEAIKKEIRDRLNFDESAAPKGFNSMLAFVVPTTGEGSLGREQVLSISERRLPWYVNDESMSHFPGGKAAWDGPNGNDGAGEAMGLKELHWGEDVRAATNQEFIMQGSVNNSICFLGPHRVINASDPNTVALIPGHGHFGPDAIPGDARWRRGDSVSLQSARDALPPAERPRPVFGGIGGGAAAAAPPARQPPARQPPARQPPARQQSAELEQNDTFQ